MPRPETPSLTVDVIIEMESGDGTALVLIERKYPPPGWALPGGFVDIGETVETAAVREAKEETGLDVKLTHLLGVYSNPERDPRGHTVSAVFIGRAEGKPRAMDDAKNAGLFTLGHLPQLAFDHAEILEVYRRFLATGQVHSLN